MKLKTCAVNLWSRMLICCFHPSLLMLLNKNLTNLPLCFSQRLCWWGGYVEVATIQIAKNDNRAHKINNQILTNNADFPSLFMISLLLQISHCVSAKNLADEEDTLRSLRSILDCSYQIAKNEDWVHKINIQILTNNTNFLFLFMILLLLQNKNLTNLPLCFSQKSRWWGGYVEVAAIHSRV